MNPEGTCGGFFNHAQNITLYNPTMIDMNNSNVMESFAKHTIAGAEFDSSARDPPPNCHPGTRLDILSTLRSWARNPDRESKFMWVYGPAGAGKSAIMQTLAESEHESQSSILGATLFFSRANKRHDPRRVVATIAYQLAVKHPRYRKYVLDFFASDPKAVEKSFTQQFKMFIVKPFAEKKLLEGLAEPVLVILDGLDECMGERAQCEIVHHIGGFAHRHPSIPLVWVIASRPEPHINATFASRSIRSSHVQLEVPVNSTQACLDVEKYLRHEFDEIRERYPTSFPSATQQWPPEAQFTKIASSASGLFAFAATLVRFVDDMDYGNPIDRLQRVLNVVNSTSAAEGQDNPFAALDALYTEVMSSIPHDILPIARMLLAPLAEAESANYLPFYLHCSWAGVNQASAYGALRRLHAVLDVPLPEDAHKTLSPFHASFIDYLIDPSRSGSFSLSVFALREEGVRCGSRIFKEAYIAEEKTFRHSRIQLSWPPQADWGYKFVLFFKAAYALLEADPQRLSESLKSVTKDCVLLLTDLNLASGWEQRLLYKLLSKIHHSPLLKRLDTHGVFHIAPIKVLDPRRFEMRVICAGQVDEELQFDTSTDCYDPWSPDSSDNEELEEEVVSALHMVARKPIGIAFVYGMSLEWEANFVSRLSMVIETAPALSVVFYGSGHNQSVLLKLSMMGGDWLVLTTYKTL